MKAGFLTPLDTRKIGPQRWLLLDDVVYRTEMFGGGVYVVPRGFQTDLASIPRALWTLFPKVDVYDPAAVIHDAAYARAIETPTSSGRVRVHLIKRYADRLFHEGLLAVGVNEIRARLMYSMVSLFGNPDAHPLAETTAFHAV